MAKYTATFSANAADTYICTAHRRRGATVYDVTLFANGTFGGGTIAWIWSPDGGSTFQPIKDLSGNPITSTAADSFNAQFGTPATNFASDQVKIYATLTGATSPVITVGAIDNR
jgi:hypothetical protein